MRRDRGLLVLAGVAVVVAALVYWDQRRPTTDEVARERQHLLPGFERARATAIEIDRRGATTRLRHEASGWWLVGPPRRRADDTAVESLLSVLEYAVVDRRIAHLDAPLRAKLGLDAPRAVVRTGPRTLRVGGDDPSRSVYVARDDEPDALVTEHRLVETADLDPRLWMSMRATLDAPSEARSIAFGWKLEHRAGWRVTAPVRVRAADAKVDALVQSLERARAIAADPAAPPATGGVTLALDGKEQARVLDDKVVRADGAFLTFRKTDLNLLLAPVEHFYERRLFPLRLDELVAVDVGPLKLRRDAGVWRVIAPLDAARPADDAKVRAFLEPLLAAEARSFSPAPPSGAATRVRLASADEEVVATVDGARARRDGETLSLELAAPLALATSF